MADFQRFPHRYFPSKVNRPRPADPSLAFARGENAAGSDGYKPTSGSKLSTYGPNDLTADEWVGCPRCLDIRARRNTASPTGGVTETSSRNRRSSLRQARPPAGAPPPPSCAERG